MKKKNYTNKKKIYRGNTYTFGGNFGDPTKVEGVLSGSLGSVTGNILNTTIGGSLTDNTGGRIGAGISNVGGKIGDAISAVNPLIGGIVSAASGLVGGLTTRAFGADFNEENIADIESKNRQMANTVVAGGSNENILAQWGSQEFGDNFTKSDIGSDGWFSNDVGRKYNRLKREQASARNRVIASYDNAIGSTENQSLLNNLANYSAHGGSIHIAPSKWHANGGFLTHGGVFSNGVTTIGNGDTHEENPYDGVQMGVDPNGIPNLVEENEVVWNNYVFSDRLKANKEIRSKYKLRGAKDISFADVAKKISKESEERPNDPISKNGLEANMVQLAMEQEILKSKRKSKSNSTKANKFSGEEDGTSLMDRYGIGNIAGIEFKDIINGTNIDDIELKDFVMPEFIGNRNNNKNNEDNAFAEYLRYAPLVGNIAGITQNVLSRPDYSAAERLNEMAADLTNAPRIGYTPLGDYITYTPVDTNIMTNKLAAESAGVRNVLSNTSSPARNAALLAADYNAQNALGDAYMKAQEQNLARRQAVASFNRGTNQANAEMGLKASMANAEIAQKAKQLGLQATLSSIQSRNAVDAARNAALSTNINSFFDNLGRLGEDIFNKNSRNFYIKHVLSSLPMSEYIRLFPQDAINEADRRSLTADQRKNLGIE